MTTPFISTDWLRTHIEDKSIRILDCSYFVPGGIEPARQQYQAGHIPNAIFFDVNAIADITNPKDHAFPDAATFSSEVGKLGIGNQHHVVAYDHLGGALAAARAWFMFRAFGHERISILAGGRVKWIAENKPLITDVPHFSPEIFRAKMTATILDKKDVLDSIANGAYQVLDARSKGRFEGTEPEPRPGLRSGHVPGSRNLPFSALFDTKTHLWKTPEQIAQLFADAGIDLKRPLATTCGSGLTACTLALGAYLAGKSDTSVYDGSWLEWGADRSLPLETGPARAPT
jgi:thiosulfate/3-mercaptopyruvate sulfurtransferase